MLIFWSLNLELSRGRIRSRCDHIPLKDDVVTLEFSQIPLSVLPIGSVLRSPIFDIGDRRTKLIGGNIEIDEAMLNQLIARGIETVSVSKRDLAVMSAGTPQGIGQEASDHTYAPVALATKHSAAIDNEIKTTDFKTEVEKQVDRSLHTPNQIYDPEAVAAEVGKREEQITYVDNLFAKLIKGVGSDADALSEICRESITSVLRDKDLFSCLSINPYDGDYPSRHSLHVSSVAISIGVVLGLDDASLMDLGTGCLIHDVGMLKLGSRIYRCKRTVTEKELSVLTEHPVLTMDTLARSGFGISRVARIVAYQIHERCNGSGYREERRVRSCTSCRKSLPLPTPMLPF